MINPNKPIRFVGDHNRPIHVAGVLRAPDTSEAVAIFSKHSDGAWWTEAMLFAKDAGKSTKRGCDLAIENAPEITSGFYPLDKNGCTTNGRGLTSLSLALSEYPILTHFVEIVCEDRVPKEAKIHVRPRPNP